MRSFSIDLVEDDANDIAGEKNGSPVDRSTFVPLVSAMLANDQLVRGNRLESEALGRCQMHRAEAARSDHLIAAIDGNGVVARRALQVPVHRFVRVAVAAAVDEHIVSTPPEIEVEHVHLAEALAHGSAAERREGPRRITAQYVIARARERDRLPGSRNFGHLERALAEEPQRHLVGFPRIRFAVETGMM